MSMSPALAAAAAAAAAASATTGSAPTSGGGGGGKPRAAVDYSKYVKRFASSAECGGAACRDLHHREHFHCLDCDARVFVKKEEMIRHFKWHKKRDESLQHGFMRYSPLDDCAADRGGRQRHLSAAAAAAGSSSGATSCTHNGKQTHYHCIHAGCDKVYISTSDVQMHANYHRKDTAIIQEGFQRYRATEECGAAHCAFFGQRTTHFHCRRANCRHTFKNKSDMEKHKTYHVKDEQLTRDGFKKFMKSEACAFAGCRFSRVCNHIHCIRPQCSYVLHSSGQLFSHKRKHERQDTELAYRRYKMAQASAPQPAEALNLSAFAHQLAACGFDSPPSPGEPAMDLTAAPPHDDDADDGDYAPQVTTTTTAAVDAIFSRKRGRPPKNRVVEVWGELPQAADAPQAIFASFKLAKPQDAAPPSPPLDGAKCADALCPYVDTAHFHCARARCLYVTDREDAAAAHAGHFHAEPADGGSDAGEDVLNLSHAPPEGPAAKVSVVKASGTFYPLSSVPQGECQSPQAKSTAEVPHSADISGSNTLYGPEHSCSRPFCKLKRKYHYHCNACNQAFSEMDRLVVHVAKHSTGALTSGSSSGSGQTHLFEDNNNQSPSPPTLKAEARIQVAPLQSLQTASAPTPPTNDDSLFLQQQPFDAYSSPFSTFPANLQFALMSQQPPFLPQSYPQLLFQSHQQSLLQQHAAYPDTSNSMSPLVAMAANLNKRALESHDLTATTTTSSSSTSSSDAKRARMHASSMRLLKDEPVPEGYLRFRFNEDCQYAHCGYREHQTHFHCQRPDCGYSFCDKTRFVQHTARHERLDTLMGGDFQQYRANVACGRPDCTHTAHLGAAQNKASHFHCLKCDFVCTDTNKVVAHRRQHQKLDSIQAAGFEKFTPSQQCRSPTCQHSGKQTHYHCLQCQYAVLGLAQMSAHKYRHMEG